MGSMTETTTITIEGHSDDIIYVGDEEHYHYEDGEDPSEFVINDTYTVLVRYTWDGEWEIEIDGQVDDDEYLLEPHQSHDGYSDILTLTGVEEPVDIVKK